jgi:hypothetical protein
MEIVTLLDAARLELQGAARSEDWRWRRQALVDFAVEHGKYGGGYSGAPENNFRK